MGATISLALARVPATDQAQPHRLLDHQPGWSRRLRGRSDLPLMYAALPEALATRFDLVGFDPRGVGQSAPVRCFASVAERTAFFAAMPTVPIGAEEEAARQRAAEELARRCGERNADVLPHLSTANVARDMDRLRQAVGDEQLTYLGSSYGTYLGATYANLFPDQIRAMVLDGVINPPSYTSADQSDGDVVGPDTTSFLRILSPQGSAAALAPILRRDAPRPGPTTAPSPPQAPRRRATSSMPSWIACGPNRSSRRARPAR